MPRVTRIAVNGLRILDGLDLAFNPLNVLIGESGAGKTSIVEACELLRKAGTARAFLEEVYRHHDGRALFRSVPGSLTLAVTIADKGSEFQYSFALHLGANGNIEIAAEQLVITKQGTSTVLIQRDRKVVELWDPKTNGLAPARIKADTLLLATVQRDDGLDAIERVQQILGSILVYLPLDTSALWARREGEAMRGPRSTVLIRPALVVERGADNLPSAFHTLFNRGQEVRTRVLDLVRLGLGDDVLDVLLPTDPGGGQISLALRIRNVGEVSSRFLSDGQLAYLTFVAILHLQPETCPLVVFDEPDHHLHPDLVRRVVGIFQELSEDRTVLITTHSDRLLDLVEDPAGAVVLLSAPEHRTLAKRPDPDALAAWLKDYRGIGELRADGVAAMVFPSEH